MEIDGVFLAEYVKGSTTDGSFHAIGGGLATIVAAQFPYTQPSLGILLRLRLRPSECDRPHRIEVLIWNDDGQPAGPKITMDGTASRDARNPTREPIMQLGANLTGLQFARPGQYSVRIVVDNNEVKAIPLYVDQASDPNQGQQFTIPQ